jgi:hypothetical protein
MKLHIYTQDEEKSKQLKRVKDLAEKVFQGVEITTSVGTPKSKKSLNDVMLVKLEDVLKFSDVELILELASKLNIGISQRTIERF